MEILKSSEANGMRRVKNGYTLLELLAVVAILLFISSVVFLRFGILSDVKEQYMLEELTNIIEYLRSDAIITHRRGVVYGDAGEDSCKYYLSLTDIDKEEKTFTLESGWTFENFFKITFTKTGAPTKGASIYLVHSSGKRYCITVEPASSMVRVKKVE